MSEYSVTTPEPAADASVQADPDRAGASRLRDRWVLALTAAMTALATVTMYVEANTEPYHIDELRQVRPYARSVTDMVDASFSQEQPPLDVLVGSLVQRVLGVGDTIQRSHSVGAAIGALILLAVLLWRAGVRVGIPVTIGVLAIAPEFVSYSAYARPYALPLCLILGFLVAADYWLDDGSKLGAAALLVFSLLLPLSRVFEPPAFLVMSSAAVLWLRRARPEWGRRVWWLVGSAGAALLLVELPVYRRLQGQLTAYQGEDRASLADQWDRLRTDSWPRLANVFEHGWLALALIVALLLRRDVRAVLARLWWCWVLLATAISFAVVFHVRTQPSQPFFERYGYYWWPPVAVMLGVLAESVVTRWNRRSVSDWLTATALTAYVVLLVAALNTDFTSTTYADYRALGEEIESRLPVSTVVVFDSISTPLGSYRPGYAGYGRYTARARSMVKAEQIPRSTEFISDTTKYAVATNGPRLDVPGWTAIPASEKMTLYLPDTDRRGPIDLADDLLAFGDRLDPSRGAVLRLGAVAILFSAGDQEHACGAMDDMIDSDPDMIGSIREAVQDTPLPDLLAACPGGNPISR